MDVKLHANATTTPKVRALIQASTASVAELARQFGISETSVRRWRGRSDVQDRPNTRHDLGQSTTPAEEALIVALRRDLRLSLDDLTEVMQRCVNPALSRSAIWRCLRRQGLSALPPQEGAVAKRGRFGTEDFGFVHIDLKHLPRLEGQPAYVFVAIERATRFVHVEIVPDRRGDTITACLARFLAAFPWPVRVILTDNGSEFTDRFAVDKRNKPEGRPSGTHPFDRLCKARGIEHRLTRPFSPQTNGMAERFNRRLAEAIRAHPDAPTNRGRNKFETQAERTRFIHAFVHAYNRTRLRCLANKAPIEALSNQTKHNTQAGAPVVARKVPGSRTAPGRPCPGARYRNHIGRDLPYRSRNASRDFHRGLVR